jgi:hypothetical protein
VKIYNLSYTGKPRKSTFVQFRYERLKLKSEKKKVNIRFITQKER